MIRLSDYVIDFLVKEEVKDVFMVSGGGGMYLIDSLGRNKNINYICNHHEQASTMSAEGYQRVTNGLGVALVTTGPAGTNTLTGVLCAWNDSIPLFVISGQANSRFLIGETGLRQRGVHEANITKIVETVTKYAVTIKDEKEIRYHLEKAVFLARNGRPGPVWLDIPLDIQSKVIEDPENLFSFNPESEGLIKPVLHQEDILELKKWLETSSRPVILAGHGIRLSKAQDEFLNFVERFRIPVVTTKNGFDLINDDNELLAGRIGINGQRAGNFAIQNADLVISLGSRLAFPTVGYETHLFARSAKKAAVDIDENQLNNSTIKIDLPINADLADFFKSFGDLANTLDKDFDEWILKCQSWRKNYPPVLSAWKKQAEYVNPYYFFEVLSEEMASDDTLVTDQGATFYCSTVAFKVKKGQRAFTNGGFSPMGYGLPAAIGAAVAKDKGKVICAHGDGGLQMNLQEIQTIVQNKLPIKLFVFNNNGYLSIKHTQTNYFGGFLVGSDPESGLSCPDTLKLAQAYGIKELRIFNHSSMRETIRKAIDFEGTVIIEVMLDPMQQFEPKVSSERKPDGRLVSKPLEDMYPFLEREEFYKEMIVDAVEE